MRQIYEQRATNPAEAKRATALEQEIVSTKTYYQKRIRELEDKYKFKVNMGKVEEGLSDLVEKKPTPRAAATTTATTTAAKSTAPAKSTPAVVD